MKLALNLAAACGLAAFLAMSAPASATTFTYELTGSTSTAYTDPAWPGWTYIDLTDSVTGSGPHPGYTLSVGDSVQVVVTLDNPVTFHEFEIGLQGMADSSTVSFDSTHSYFSGGIGVPAPSSIDFGNYVGTRGGLGFGGGFFSGSDTFSFDKVIIDTVITAMTDPSGQSVSFIDLTERYAPYIGFYNSNPATTPIPGGLLLMTTALGGLGIFVRRKRVASAEA